LRTVELIFRDIGNIRAHQLNLVGIKRKAADILCGWVLTQCKLHNGTL